MFTRYDLMGYGFGLSAVLILKGLGFSLPWLLAAFFVIVVGMRVYGQRKAEAEQGRGGRGTD